MSKPFVIYCPDYQPTSGGIKVMWGLFGALLAKGVEVYMNSFPGGEFTVIYPEIITGNPAGARNVIRYLLNKPGVMGLGTAQGFHQGPTSFAPTDKLYVFSELFNTMGVDDKHHLFLPVINTHIFKDYKGIRRKTAVFVGKGYDAHAHPEGSIYIDRGIARDQQALADLLNECHTLYSYDPVSAMTEVARLAGCQVAYYGEYSKEDLVKYEPGMNGMGYREVPKEFDSDTFREHYLEMRREFDRRLDLFIDENESN